MDPISRYQSRKDELDALKGELENHARKGDPGPVAQRVLEAAGDLLRRTQRVPADSSLVDAALKLLTADGLESFADGLSTQELRSRLQRCADEAVEAALPDSDEDSGTWSQWAMQGLLARDRAESARCALDRLIRLGRTDATPVHARLAAALEQLDADTKYLAAALTALNASRRTERDLLDPEVRAHAWWFSARADAHEDGLVKALGSDDSSGLSGAEAAVSKEVGKPRKRPASFDELFRFDLGLATDAEGALIAAQKKVSPDFAKALAAMEEGERAILELTGGAPIADNVRPLRRAAGQGPGASSGSGQVVEERHEFRVLLFRRAQRVHLVVQPARDGALAAAAVFLPDAPERGRPSHATEAGLDFELGPEQQLERVTARVVVTLKGGRSTTLAVKL
ncbi:MAG: hypothetical protein IPJ65_18970 [Archangiaceae bacterium]|nr:hypothetical protein [Archangiaceae bacterium]